jgi:L-asparaginase
MPPEVVFVGTGGTIASLGKNPFDILDYGRSDIRLPAHEVIASVPSEDGLAQIRSIAFRSIDSEAVSLADWSELATLCEELARADPLPAGIVIGHGTASLEETAYCLSLTLGLTIPVVIVGSMRPLNGLSSDAALNLISAVRVASNPRSIGRGVLVVLNDEIHSARDVTKTSTFRLHAFQSPDFGILGQVDGNEVQFYRQTERRHTMASEFAVADIARMPRVDIAYSYVGADGAAIRAFIDAGAKGIVSAGFGPGAVTPAEFEALKEARSKGIVVVQSSRVGSGRTLDAANHRSLGIIAADNLTPPKARILLGLSLARDKSVEEISDIFKEY